MEHLGIHPTPSAPGKHTAAAGAASRQWRRPLVMAFQHRPGELHADLNGFGKWMEMEYQYPNI